MTPAQSDRPTRIDGQPGDLPPIAVVLDIDGVIAPIGGPARWGDDTLIGDPDTGLHLSPSMCAALENLPRPDQVGCYWLTDWSQAMRHHLDLLPGRSWGEITAPTDTPVGPARAEDRGNPALWWKQRALDSWLRRHLEVRHVVWIDDRLHPRHVPTAAATDETRATWTGTCRLAGRRDVLLVAPDKRAGLTPDDLSTLIDWIDTHTGTTSLGSRRGATGAAGPTLIDDAHPCEGTGSDPQDLLPDDRAWGSRTPPPSRP